MPLKPDDFLILLVLVLVLSRGKRHGYGIMKEVESESGGEVALGIGSLYRLLGRMMRAGLVATTNVLPSLPSEDRGDHDRSPEYCRI